MKTIATFQSKESATSAGDPSGLADLSSTVNTAALDESDFRWAIEGINAQTFVASTYATIGDYTSRNNTTGTQEYRTLRGGDLTAHGGVESAVVSVYPALGRVWDICDDYPTLVWEENNSCTGTGSSSSSSSSASTNPGGLSDAEDAEYLASGLTLEQFLAARLAATGVPSSALSLGFGAMLALLGLGVALVWVTRRERVAGQL